MNANTYDSPSTTGGNREWLEDELYILEPEEVPFFSMVSKPSDVMATYHEVVADRLRAARTSGTREGDSGPKGGNKATKRARFGSYLHRWFDTFGVTDVQQAISRKGGTAGVDNEYAWAKTKAIREVKRDIEATLLGSQETNGGDEDEMTTRGAFGWIKASGQSPTVPADYCPPAAQVVSSVTALLESSVSGVLSSLSDQGGSGLYEAFVGGTYMDDIDLFAVQYGGASGTKFTSPVTLSGGSTKEWSAVVSVFQTSKGRVVFHNDKFINVNSAGTHNGDAMLIAQMDQWSCNFLEPLHAEDDESDAGGESGYVKAIGGLFCTMPRGNAVIYGTLN